MAITIIRNIPMNIVQKAFIAAMFAAAVGSGIHEMRRAIDLQRRTQALQRENDLLAEQLQNERDENAQKLAATQQSGYLRPDLSELLRLRAQVTGLRNARMELAQLKNTATPEVADPAASEMKPWLDRVKKLKAGLAKATDQNIPELQFLTDEDWIEAAQKINQLDTQADFDQAFSALRKTAKNEFATRVQSTLRGFAQANNNQLPADLSQLQGLFASSVDDSVLQRYQMTESGVVIEKSTPLDDQDDVYYQISMNGVGIVSGNVAETTLQPARQAFSAANNGQMPTDPSQLLPYVSTAAQQAALQKLLGNTAAK
jgi:hypothetical protein